MLRVIYRREFHIYLTALYAPRRAKPILTRLVPMMTSTLLTHYSPALLTQCSPLSFLPG
jgi:hypothetical protein